MISNSHPTGWAGDLEIIKVPQEISDKPIIFNEVIRSDACYSLKGEGLLELKNINFDAKFVNANGQTVKLVRVESISCKTST